MSDPTTTTTTTPPTPTPLHPQQPARVPATARPIPQAPDAEGNYEGEYVGYKPSFWRQPWVQQVIPWTTSIGVHAGLVALAIAALVVGAAVTKNDDEVLNQVVIPTTVLARDQVGGVPNVGNMDDLTSQNRSLNPVAASEDYRDAGAESNAAVLSSTAGGSESSSISGITGMSAMSDALGGGGGDGSPLFGDAGGGQSFMGIDIGRPGDGGNARRIAFVCDSSGSMGRQDKDVLLLRELSRFIEPLAVDQSFNVFFFSNNSFEVAFPGELKPATQRFKDQAFAFLGEEIVMSGTTNPIPALEAALRMKPELLFFLTDGEFNGVVGYSEVEAAITRLNSDEATVVNTIQFITRSEEAERVLKRISDSNGGVYRYVALDDL